MPQELDIGDPFEFWTDRAARAANRLSLGHISVPEAISIVRNALGEDWLRTVSTLRSTAEVPFKPHRLGDCLTIAGDGEIVEIVELALYLRTLHDVPGLSEVFPVLRDDYWTARQQLAFAFRFRTMGSEDLRFEPAVGTNRADLSFGLRDQHFTLESFYPRYGSGTPTAVRIFFRRATKLIERIGEMTSRVLRVTVRLFRSPDHAEARQLEGWVLRLVRESLNSKAEIVTSGAGGKPPWYDRNELAEIVIEDISAVTPDPDFAGGSPMDREEGTVLVVVARSVDRKDLSRVRDGTVDEATSPRASRLRVIDAGGRKAGRRPEEVASALVRKLQRKVTQLGDVPRGSARLLLVNVPWMTDRHDEENATYVGAILDQIRRKIIDGRSRMGGVLAVARAWTGRRHQYRGIMVEGEAAAGLAGLIEEELNSLDGTGDVFDHWNNSGPQP